MVAVMSVHPAFARGELLGEPLHAPCSGGRMTARTSGDNSRSDSGASRQA